MEFADVTLHLSAERNFFCLKIVGWEFACQLCRLCSIFSFSCQNRLGLLAAANIFTSCSHEKSHRDFEDFISQNNISQELQCIYSPKWDADNHGEQLVGIFYWLLATFNQERLDWGYFNGNVTLFSELPRRCTHATSVISSAANTKLIVLRIVGSSNASLAVMYATLS